MLELYRNAMQTAARARVVAISGAVFGLLLFLLNATDLPFSIRSLSAVSSGHTILNILQFYTGEEAYQHIAAYGDAGAGIYRQILQLDAWLLIPAYVLFLGAGTLHAGDRVWRGGGQGWLRLAVLFPLGAGLCNYLEDGVVWYLLGSFPDVHMTLANICGVLTALKTVFMTAALAVVLWSYAAIGLTVLSYRWGWQKCHL